MAQSTGGGTLTSVYENRIGRETNANEAIGYWTFVLGILSGLLGIVLAMLSSSPGELIRGAGIALASLGLLMLIIGPILRLPLERRTTLLSYLGAAISLLAIVWFVVAYPSEWRAGFINQEVEIMGLYVIGILVVASGGVFVPLLTRSTTERDAAEHRAAQAEAKRDAAIEEIHSTTERDAADHRAAQAEAERDAAIDEIEANDERDERVADLEMKLAARERKIEELQGELSDESSDRNGLVAGNETLRTSESQFEFYEDRGGRWRWRLRHRSGDVIAASDRGHEQPHPAQTAVRAVRRDALGATTLLVESENELPDEGTSDGMVLPDLTESQATFEVYVGEGEDHRWRLIHDNGKIIANAAQGYASRSGAEHSIEAIREYVGPAEYLQPDPTAIEIYRDEEDNYRWRLLHKNGNILGGSGEGYTSGSEAREAIDELRDGIDEAEIEVYEDERAAFRWRLRGAEEKVTFDSTGYESRRGAEDAVERVRMFLPEADLIDIGQPPSTSTRAKEEISAGDSATATGRFWPTARRDMPLVPASGMESRVSSGTHPTPRWRRPRSSSSRRYHGRVRRLPM
jgi:uncharacterized protein YegP (UPF0339 family)